MDYTSENRQQKFREKMKETGKKQRTFFLSDAAMGAIKNCKLETKSPSLNHSLESMLTRKKMEATEPIIIEKIVTVSEPTAEQQAILDQARIVADAYRTWKQSPGNETGKTLGVEAGNLAALF